MRRITIDFAIPIVVAGAFVALTNFIGDKWIDKMEEKSEEVIYSDSIIGAAATDDVPVVSSIEEMLEEDCFTFHIYDTPSGIHDSAYYDGVVYDILELESGEWVLVDDYFPHTYFDHEEKDDDDWVWSSDIYAVYPVGKVVHKTVPDKLIEEFAKYGYVLSDTSFYVDMSGDFELFSREDYE
ncbi:MAG: hypothetical protein IJA32_05010 [Lachnospiraceae bacterium]|nr:hypothetical protein [Lachnospiraceae bacterium]